MLLEITTVAGLIWGFTALSWAEHFGGFGVECSLMGLMLLGVSRLP